MEKERKGLFERLMDFWREKIYMVGEDKIGFWYEKDSLEEHCAEFFLKDSEYEGFLKEIREVLKDKEEFCKLQETHIKKIESK